MTRGQADFVAELPLLCVRDWQPKEIQASTTAALQVALRSTHRIVTSTWVREQDDWREIAFTLSIEQGL